MIGIYHLQLGKGRLQWLRDRCLKPEDVRGQVAYFRAFLDDRRWADTGFGGYLWITVTDEEVLVKSLSRLREVFAIGRQGELIPPVGARRMYFKDSEWQDAARTIMRDASIVLLRPHVTKWVLWELGQIVEICDPWKVILWTPRGIGEEEWRDFRRQAKAECGIDLPGAVEKIPFLMFEENWQCYAVNSIKRLSNRLSERLVTG
jgi:hypothetical protein